ncbi:hypothetical protein ACXZ1M_24290 [Duganella sp. PWIR1]
MKNMRDLSQAINNLQAYLLELAQKIKGDLDNHLLSFALAILLASVTFFIVLSLFSGGGLGVYLITSLSIPCVAFGAWHMSKYRRGLDLDPNTSKPSTPSPKKSPPQQGQRKKMNSPKQELTPLPPSYPTSSNVSHKDEPAHSKRAKPHWTLLRRRPKQMM